MQEFKNLGLFLAVAVLGALIFVVLWVYNITSDHNLKINTVGMVTSTMAEHFTNMEKEHTENKSSILDLVTSLKENQKAKRFELATITENFRRLEAEIKKINTDFSLQEPKKYSKGKKSKKYESDSDESGNSTDTDEELERRKRQKKKGKL